MSGFRLDRRADALRGGTQSDIGPGNAQGSRLYHRLIGTAFGLQMPPAGRLSDGQIDTIKQWIDEGAVWPDAVAGETPAPPADPDATRLMTLIRDDHRPAIDELLRKNARAANARGTRGSTPLMAAALYGDAALVKRLLTAGADPNAANSAGATALMWAVPDPDKMRLLLDAGADVNARSEDRRSALVVTSGIVGAAPALRLLLEYGADLSVWQATDPSPLREAARADDAEMFHLLLEYGASPKGAGAVQATLLRTLCSKCAELVAAGGPLPRRPPEPARSRTAPRYDPGRAARPTPIGETPVTPAAIRAAVERSLPLLQDVGVAFIKQTGCVSCHHNSLVSMAVAAARANGYAVNETTAKKQSSLIGAYLESWRERTVQNIQIAGAVDTISYLMFGLAADNYSPDAATDAQAMWLKRRQAPDGHWALSTIRPPIESNDIAVTAVSMRALQVFAPPSRRAEYTEGGRSRTCLAHDRAGDGHRRARVPSPGVAVGGRAERGHQARGARSPGGPARRWRMGAARDDGERCLRDRRGAGRLARERRVRAERPRVPQRARVPAAHADRRRIVAGRDAGGPDSGVFRERLSLRRQPVDFRRRDRLGDHRARARE